MSSSAGFAGGCWGASVPGTGAAWAAGHSTIVCRRSKKPWCSATMKRMTPSTSANRAFRTGWTIVAVSVGIAAAGWYTLAAEQAQDPRQKDFGVGILAVLFGAPVVILLPTGIGILLYGRLPRWER